ncbi:scavenger receptor class F member 1-like [Littorina saxatilis]|uniref:scavenger receptor class F member 1-like n=1 Tax=Littorina saxatilis TaxID=31220 RepID=UPI0038B467B0
MEWSYLCALVLGLCCVAPVVWGQANTSACSPGWYGIQCPSPCYPNQNCLLNTCDRTTGSCLACNAGYAGSSCTECVEGFSKNNTTTCSPCSAFCSTGGCDKVSGNCNDGECVAGRWGSKCENKCAPNCATGTCDTTAGKCFDGTTQIKDQAGLRDRWIEHFSDLLNRPSTVDPAALSQIP